MPPRTRPLSLLCGIVLHWTNNVPRFFATCARGLEPLLAGELEALGGYQVTQGRGGVHFTGGQTTLYAANLWLRTAIRVLQPILQADVHSPDELYEAVRSLDWVKLMTPEHTLAVDCNVRDSNITHSQYAARRVKDAICDQFRERTGRRPSVDTETPMIGLNLHIARNHAILSLDSSGDSLHKRGYRPILTKAPLNEALAAGLLLQTGWTGTTPLVDPLCGSGTFAIEGAWLSLRRPPGLTRKRFGFQGWMDFDAALWSDLREEARQGVARQLPAPIIGRDIRRDAIEFARKNARAAGIGPMLDLDRGDIADFTPPDGPPGVFICNPPYGERIGEEKELIPLYETIGRVIRERCIGWDCYVFTSDRRLGEALGMKPRRMFPFFNGRLECRLLWFTPRQSKKT